AEAEYRGVANVVAETTWLPNLLRELHSPLSTATLVYCDNVSAVYMSVNPVQHQQIYFLQETTFTTTIALFPGDMSGLSLATCRWGKLSPATCRWGILAGEAS
ncbi:ribonuclease H-like domain-containing protein, partial [Tanacetum coccineum]